MKPPKHGQKMQPSKMLSQSHCSWQSDEKRSQFLKGSIWQSPYISIISGKVCENIPEQKSQASQTSHFLKRRMPSFPERPRWSSRCGTQRWNPPEPLPAPRKCPGRSLRCPRLRAESPRARYEFHVDKETNLSYISV